MNQLANEAIFFCPVFSGLVGTALFRPCKPKPRLVVLEIPPLFCRSNIGALARPETVLHVGSSNLLHAADPCFNTSHLHLLLHCLVGLAALCQ